VLRGTRAQDAIELWNAVSQTAYMYAGRFGRPQIGHSEISELKGCISPRLLGDTRRINYSRLKILAPALNFRNSDSERWVHADGGLSRWTTIVPEIFSSMDDAVAAPHIMWVPVRGGFGRSGVCHRSDISGIEP
jgi:hypothetical protein